MTLIINLLEFLTPYGMASYVIMFAILLACGFGFPMPEDVILVTGGMLAARGITSFEVTHVLCMAGVLIGDGIIFTIGKYFSDRVASSRFYRRIITPSREKKINKLYAKHGDKMLFIARFTPGLRMPMFLTAGIFKVSTWKFLAIDGFAALISVPVWISIGYVFGKNLELLDAKIQQYQVATYSILGGVLLIFLVAYFIKKPKQAGGSQKD